MAKTIKETVPAQHRFSELGSFKSPTSTINLLEQFLGGGDRSGTSKSQVDFTRRMLNAGVLDHPYKYESYESAYKNIPIIAGAVDKIVDFVVGPGFYAKAEKKETEKILNTWMDDNNFDYDLRTIVRNAVIFGIAPTELTGKGEKTRTIILDPKTIFVKIDDSGEIESYCQYIRGRKVADWKLDEIAFFPYNSIGNDPYGNSVLRSLFGFKDMNLVQNYLEMEQNMALMIRRKANAPIHVKIGSDLYPAQQGDIDTFAQNLAYLRNNQEFVTNHLVEMDVVGFRQQIIDFRPYVAHYENSIVYGLQVPVVLMGIGNVNEGLANVQMDAFERHIKSVQSSVIREVENKIFKRITPDKSQFCWNDPTDATEDQRLLRMENLLKTPGLSDQTRKDVEMEMRKILGFKEIDITPNPITQPGQKFGGTSGDNPIKKDKPELKPVKKSPSKKKKTKEDNEDVDVEEEYIDESMATTEDLTKLREDVRKDIENIKRADKLKEEEIATQKEKNEILKKIAEKV